MSNASEFWQYAEEALLSASQCETDNEREVQLNLARAWTQAALRSEVAIASAGPSPPQSSRWYGRHSAPQLTAHP
jgi:hypothetical protein